MDLVIKVCFEFPSRGKMSQYLEKKNAAWRHHGVPGLTQLPLKENKVKFTICPNKSDPIKISEVCDHDHRRGQYEADTAGDLCHYKKLNSQTNATCSLSTRLKSTAAMFDAGVSEG
jgi:hypothetical protein